MHDARFESVLALVNLLFRNSWWCFCQYALPAPVKGLELLLVVKNGYSMTSRKIHEIESRSNGMIQRFGKRNLVWLSPSTNMFMSPCWVYITLEIIGDSGRIHQIHGEYIFWGWENVFHWSVVLENRWGWRWGDWRDRWRIRETLGGTLSPL